MNFKKPKVMLIVKILVITTLFFGTYYLLFLKPSLANPQSIIETKKILAKQESLLIQNRLAIVELNKINPTSANYGYVLTHLYEIIMDTKTEGLKEIKDTLPEPNPMPEILIKYPSMQKEYKEILEAQYQFIENQKELDEKFGPMFEYFPKRDFNNINEETKNIKIDAAIKGMEKIKQNLPETSSTIQKAQEALKKYSIDNNIDALSTTFDEVKKDLFKIKSSQIKSDKQLELIARQTTLLNLYRFYIQKLTDRLLPEQLGHQTHLIYLPL